MYVYIDTCMCPYISMDVFLYMCIRIHIYIKIYSGLGPLGYQIQGEIQG